MINPWKLIWIVASLVVLIGCKKSQKADASSTAAPPTIAASPATGPTIDTAEFRNSMDAAADAIKRKEFETAAKSLVGIQMSGVQMTPQQADAYTANMRRLQTSLADAPANDPKAEATRALLRNTGRGPVR